MRARLIAAWPSLSRVYGLHPWDLPRLSVAELNAYIEDLDALSRAATQSR